jgi:hypothetical protein
MKAMVGPKSKQHQYAQGEGDLNIDSELKKIELEEQLLNLQEKRLDLEQKRIELELRKLMLSSNNRKLKKSKSTRSPSGRNLNKSADEWSDNEDRLLNNSRHGRRTRNKSGGNKLRDQSEEESVGSDDEDGMGIAKSSDDDILEDPDPCVDSGSTEGVSPSSLQDAKSLKTLVREDSTVSQTASSASHSSTDNASPPNTEPSNNLSDSQRKSLIKNLETIGVLAQAPTRRESEPYSRDPKSSSSPNTPIVNDKKGSKVLRKAESTRDSSKERVNNGTRRSSNEDVNGAKPVRERSADTRASTKTTKMSNESRGPADNDTSILDITTITVTADACGNKQETSSDNKRTGYFVYTWPDGRQYSGDWLDGKFHGQGTYTWPNGGRYMGAYKNGLKHGSGVYEWADGNKYDGEFKLGRRHGKGLQLNEDGSVFHNGAWKEDEPVN